MYRIIETSDVKVNQGLDTLRETNNKLALKVRKLYSNVKNKMIETADANGIIGAYNGKILSDIEVLIASAVLVNLLDFEDRLENLDDLDLIETDSNNSNRYEFMEYKEYSEMNPRELCLVLYKDLGTEIENSINSMTSGLKVKLDMLDEIKELLINNYPDVREELLEAKLANALALTKEKYGSSLATVEGNLALYDMLSSDKVTDSKNFQFLAKIGADKTAELDILILQSAFKSYKEHIIRGELPVTPNELNLAITKIVTGVKPVTEENKNKILNLKF